MLNGEPFSDRPRSVCPALREFLQGYNDGLPDDLRQELYALASALVETHAPAPVAAWRARLCVGWARSVAAIEAVPTRFPGPTLSDCGRAGRYTARVARGNRWCHNQTLAFFSWLARPRDRGLLQPTALLRQTHRLGAVAGVQLLHDRRQVVAHRPVRQIEGLGQLGDGGMLA
jgi:hypothetical protein